MTQYVTRTEFADQGLPAEALTGLSNATIDEALVWASSVCDMYLRKRHKLPLVAWEEDLRALVCDLAAWRILKRKGFNPNAPAHQAIVKSYDEAILTLKDLVKGLIELGVTDSSPDLDEEGPLAAFDTAPDFRYFTGSDDCG
jgi:phage gp36-like protein